MEEGVVFGGEDVDNGEEITRDILWAEMDDIFFLGSLLLLIFSTSLFALGGCLGGRFFHNFCHEWYLIY